MPPSNCPRCRKRQSQGEDDRPYNLGQEALLESVMDGRDGIALDGYYFLYLPTIFPFSFPGEDHR
jgi:hypothetical protein